VLGDFPTHERLVRDLVAGSRATAVFVDYDRAPEARYPVAVRQAYAATRWVAGHVTNAAFDTDSYERFAEGHFLTRDMMRWFWDSYVAEPRARRDVYASPLRAGIERLTRPGAGRRPHR
jgi:acetyl esterase